ncbi:hypothetical protein GCM10027160_21630 [Streptomyces calidiresistens]
MVEVVSEDPSATAPDVNGAPHWEQNRLPVGIGVEQRGHLCVGAAPMPPAVPVPATSSRNRGRPLSPSDRPAGGSPGRPARCRAACSEPP